MKGSRIAPAADSPGEDVQLWQRCRRLWRILHETYPHLSVAHSESARVCVACEQLLRSMVQDETCLEQETRLAEFARVLLEDCGERPTAVTNRMVVPAVRRARDYLHAHYRESVRLEELATVAGVSRFHLAHIFTRAIGFSPHTYQNHLRVAEARRQLRSGVHPAHVDVGFTDQSHLGRHFKRIVGITPGEYAARTGLLSPGSHLAARTF